MFKLKIFVITNICKPIFAIFGRIGMHLAEYRVLTVVVSDHQLVDVVQLARSGTISIKQNRKLQVQFTSTA
jgi:hypothetical protein